MSTPRHHTPRTPGSRTLGGKAALIAEAIGKPLHDWQRDAVDVALELDDNGRLRYRYVYLSVPRQCGKTVLSMIIGLTRTLVQAEARVWYTAQTGQAARERWLKEVATPVESRLPGLASVKRGAGDTRLVIPGSLSEFRPMPPTGEYLHGEQSDLVLVDEAWVHTEVSGEELTQAVSPTFQSRADTKLGVQLWKLSTMGTAASIWWHDALNKAIEGEPKTAVIDYGIAPNVSAEDVDAVIAAHPLSHKPNIAEFIREEAQGMSPGQFARAYGNRATKAKDRVISLEAWEMAQTTLTIPADAPVTFAAAIDMERTETAIAACALVDGIPVIEMVDRRPGVAWGADRLVELMERHGAPAPWVDPVGPSGTLHDELVGRGVDMNKFAPRDLTRACAAFMDRVTHRDSNGDLSPTVGIRPDDGLDFAVDAAAIRNIGEAWAWQRSVIGSIASLEAATLALYGALHRPAAPAAPMIYV